MSRYVVMVDFRLKPGARTAFRTLVDLNARLSAHDEPGCRRFDVVEPDGEADRVLLYEIYDDRAAFDAHMKTKHYFAFDAESAEMVASKIVTTGGLVCEGSA
ncbi:putative quinol monooxygenase [Labrys okinawensis]|uniref:putative quinol monooxygenase n=1 Tax=Labrys okinawensis TaxID=346911 RepID=UPI0039BC5CC0